MNKEQHITRYWCRSRNNVLNGEGFLRTRRIATEPFDPKEEDIFTWDEISNYKSLVLLGEAGSGKSTSIIRELSVIDNVIYCNLAEFCDESRLINEVFFSPRFSECKNSGKPLTLCLDDIDVAFKNIKTLPLILKRQLKEIEGISSLLSLRIICRSGCWTKDLDEFFKIYFGDSNHEIFQIAPLSKGNILQFGASDGVDDAFINEIIKNEMQPFAINPVSLKLLISEYKQNKRLSGTRSQLYDNGCKALCAEPKADRQFEESSLSIDKKLAIASRIAALMVFCNKSHIDIQQNPPFEERKLSLSDIQEGGEITDKYIFDFTHTDIIEVVTNTGLFSYVNQYSYSFFHWSYAEYLAARFIVNHEFSVDQIMSLITISSDTEGMVVEQVKGTASWLGTLSETLLEKSINQDPLSLLAGDVISIRDNHKKLLIESMFDKLRTMSITDGDWSLKDQYDKLKYSGLGDQIRPYLTDKANHFLTRRVAVDIIEACEIREVSDDLLTIVMDKSADLYLRKRAINALSNLGNEEHRRSLIPYAIEPQDDDVDDEIKGAALRATWPDIINTAEVFESITPIKRNNLFGAYVSFINYVLAERIENKYLSDALRWCQKYPQFIDKCSSNTDMERLNDIIIYKCWQNYDSLDNKHLFAEVLSLRIEHHADIFPTPSSFRNKWESLSISRDIRHDACKYLINLEYINENTIYYLWNTSLINNEDFDFAHTSFTTEQDVKLRMKWARLLWYFEYSDASRIDLILRLVGIHNELKTVFGLWLQTIELGSDHAIGLKKQWTERQKWINPKTTPASTIDVQDRLSQRIINLETTNNWAYFTEFFRDITLTPTSKVYGDILNPNVTDFDAWRNLTDTLKSKVISLGKTFLESHNDDYTDWFGQNMFHSMASTGYKCLVLLNKYESNILANISGEVWGNWVHIILAYPQSSGFSGTDQSYKTIIQHAYSKIPDVLIDILGKLIMIENKQDDSTLFILRKIEHIIDDRMVNAFEKLIDEGVLYANPSADLIRHLFKHRYDTASKIAKKVLVENINLKSILIGVEFAKYCNGTDWDYIMNHICNKKEFAEQFFLKYASDYHRRENPLWNRINENQIGSLYVLLCNMFPPEEDPKFDGVHYIGSREEVASFRESLLQHLTNKGTSEAVLALEFIREKMPSDGIMFQIVAAKNNYRKLNWRPFAPSEFLRLSENGNMRVITNNADLLNLITESLYRFEERLQKGNALSFMLWDYVKEHPQTKKSLFKPKNEELLSDLIKDHLSSDIQKYGVLSFREVQIKRANITHGGKEGERTDVFVSYYNSRYQEENKVIIEVKGSWNKGVKNSMKTQLVDRYLDTTQGAYGLYLIGWFDCEACDESKYKNHTGAASIDDAKTSYEVSARDLSSNNAIVKSFILDCRMRN